MRVVGGILGGRTLRAPRGMATRPTSERVREAVFNILGDVGGLAVLDLFAGAGALGIEALSRGARAATFVDQAAEACRCIEANLAALGLEATVVRAAVARALPRLAGPFDLVFIDPPYAGDDAIETLAALGDSALLAPEALVVVEHDRRRPPAERYGGLAQIDRRRYGDTEVSFLRFRGHA